MGKKTLYVHIYYMSYEVKQYSAFTAFMNDVLKDTFKKEDTSQILIFLYTVFFLK